MGVQILLEVLLPVLWGTFPGGAAGPGKSFQRPVGVKLGSAESSLLLGQGCSSQALH